MALRRGSLHLLGSVLQAARSSGELPATLKPTLQPSSLRNCQLVLKAAGTQVAAGLTSQAQYSIIKPAGAGGPVVRTAVYAIFELGSAQFKVSAGDLIYVERLVGVDVGAELALKRVQAAGSRQETLVGRPYVSGASITAVVEVSLLGKPARSYIFKGSLRP